jgi:hypothetical protein
MNRSMIIFGVVCASLHPLLRKSSSIAARIRLGDVERRNATAKARRLRTRRACLLAVVLKNIFGVMLPLSHVDMRGAIQLSLEGNSPTEVY